MRYTQDLQFEPRLAEKYERIDDKTVRFHLRKVSSSTPATTSPPMTWYGPSTV